jgi:hypothetical protein
LAYGAARAGSTKPKRKLVRLRDLILTRPHAAVRQAGHVRFRIKREAYATIAVDISGQTAALKLKTSLDAVQAHERRTALVAELDPELPVLSTPVEVAIEHTNAVRAEESRIAPLPVGSHDVEHKRQSG